MRLVFVVTPSPWLVRQDAQFPYGTLCLATAVREEGHDVSVVHWGVEDIDQPDVLVFGGTTLEWPVVVSAAKLAREKYPGASLWYGGVHATAMPNETLDSRLFDAVGLGEGDEIIVRMCRDLADNRLGPIYLASLVGDLGRLPIPDRTIPGFRPGGGIFAFEDDDISITLASSRGCNFACAFCGSDNMWGKHTRWRPVEHVVREIEEAGCSHIKFLDDSLPSNRPRLRELSQRLKPMGLMWMCSARSHDLTEETCDLLVEGGCREVHVGVESADQSVLDHLLKRTTVEVQRRGCDVALRAGLDVRLLWMIGTPGEKPHTPELNRDFMERLAGASHSLATFIPLPGTAIWSTPADFGVDIISRDFTQFNQYYRRKEGGGVIEAEYVPLIRNHSLTSDQQADNVMRMRRYIQDTQAGIQG